MPMLSIIPWFNFMSYFRITLKNISKNQFNQSESTDRSQLVTQTASLFEYKELVVSHINQLTSHSLLLNAKLAI